MQSSLGVAGTVFHHTNFIAEAVNIRRPVGVPIDEQGALLVADHVGNAIWRVTPSEKSAAK